MQVTPHINIYYLPKAVHYQPPPKHGLNMSKFSMPDLHLLFADSLEAPMYIRLLVKPDKLDVICQHYSNVFGQL